MFERVMNWLGGVLLLTLAACAPGGLSYNRPGVSSPASGSAASNQAATAQTGWDGLVAAAKQEGKVAVITQPGNAYRELMDDFQKQYGVTVDIYAGNTQDEIVAKVGAERQAGQFNWDLVLRNSTLLFSGLKPIAALDPLRPALLLPEVLDEAKWMGGFDAGWTDRDKALSYSFVVYLDRTISVNRSVVPESQFNALDQLWDPRWKGKIASQDVRAGGNGASTMTNWLALMGEEKLRTLLRDQQLTMTQDRRQLVEWVVRGQYPIGIAIDGPTMLDFTRQGVDVSHVKPLAGDDPGSVKISHGPSSVGLFNRPAHPNAGKLLLNWLLSREGAADFANRTGYNVRRLDVPIVNPDTAVDPKGNYFDIDNEDGYYKYYTKELEIAKQELK